MRVSAYQEVMKSDPRFKAIEEAAKALVAKKLKNGGKL